MPPEWEFDFSDDVPASCRYRLGVTVRQAHDAVHQTQEIDLVVLGIGDRWVGPTKSPAQIAESNRVWDDAVLQSVLAICREILSLLAEAATRNGWEPTRYARAVKELKEQAVVKTWDRMMDDRRLSLDAFEKTVDKHLQKWPTWCAVQAMGVQAPAASDEGPPLTVPEAAKKLHMGEKTVRRMIAKGEIIATNPGERLTRISRAEVTRVSQLPKNLYR